MRLSSSKSQANHPASMLVNVIWPAERFMAKLSKLLSSFYVDISLDCQITFGTEMDGLFQLTIFVRVVLAQDCRCILCLMS